MDCRKVKALLVRLLEADVSEKVGAQIEAHLRECRACSRERDLLIQSWELLDRYETPTVSDNFTPSLMRRIRSEPVRGAEPRLHPLGGIPGRTQWRLASVLAASLVVVVALGVLCGPRLFDSWAARTTPSDPVVPVRPVSDEEIIQDLEIYANIELLQDLDFLSDFDVIENLDESV